MQTKRPVAVLDHNETMKKTAEFSAVYICFFLHHLLVAVSDFFALGS